MDTGTGGFEEETKKFVREVYRAVVKESDSDSESDEVKLWRRCSTGSKDERKAALDELQDQV